MQARSVSCCFSWGNGEKHQVRNTFKIFILIDIAFFSKNKSKMANDYNTDIWTCSWVHVLLWSLDFTSWILADILTGCKHTKDGLSHFATETKRPALCCFLCMLLASSFCQRCVSDQLPREDEPRSMTEILDMGPKHKLTALEPHLKFPTQVPLVGVSACLAMQKRTMQKESECVINRSILVKWYACKMLYKCN